MGKLKTFFLCCVLGLGSWATPSYAAALMDGRSLRLVGGFRVHQRVSPASLTKLMTLYLLFEALDTKKVSLDTVWITSLNASNQPASHWGLAVGQKVTVRQCVIGLSVRSCNDMAVLIAEKIGGSVQRFVRVMNAKARALGMKNTTFCNPSGLYRVGQYSTAHDMALLMGKLCKHFPRYASCLGIRSFLRGKEVLRNTNKLLGKVSGLCAGKTGFTALSGWNLATVTVRHNRPLIAVVMGMNAPRTRNQHMIRLIDTFYNCPGRLDKVLRAPAQSKALKSSAAAKKKSAPRKKLVPKKKRRLLYTQAQRGRARQ